MHSICEKNPRKKKVKLSEEFLDGPFVSQILKESTYLFHSYIINYYYYYDYYYLYVLR